MCPPPPCLLGKFLGTFELSTKTLVICSISGIKNYPVIFRDYFVSHEFSGSRHEPISIQECSMTVAVGEKIPPSGARPRLKQKR